MSLPFTQNNHLIYGYAGSSEEYVPGGDFFLKIGEVRRETLNPFEEATKVAFEIYSKKTDLWVLLSGGVDSEAMCSVFIKNKIPFRVGILRFKNDLNHYDIKHAIDYCSEHNLTYEIIDLDIIDYFYSGRYMNSVDAYRCTSPQLCSHLEIMKLIPGTTLMPWNPVHIRNHGHGPTAELPQDYYFCYYRLLEKEKKSGVPFFFLYTPELIASFLRLEVTRQSISSVMQKTPEQDYALKCAQYNSGGFSVLPRKQKYTGFEQVKVEIAKIENGDLTTFDKLFRYPLMEKYPHPKTSRSILPKNILGSVSPEYFRF